MTGTTHQSLGEAGDLSRRRIQLREVSGHAGLESVGHDLRAARLRRGDDLGAISRVLRIRQNHLEAIEEGRLEDLPGRTYAIGFARSYAEYLGLDPAECAQRFKSENAGRDDGSTEVGPPPDAGRELPSGWTWAAVLVVAVVAYGGYELARSADWFSTPQVSPVPARIAPPTTAGRLVPAQRTASRQTAKARLLQAGNGSGRSTIATFLPQPSTAAASDAAVPPSAAILSEGVSPGQVLGAQNQHVRVVLHARALTRVLVQGLSGKVYLDRLLHPGDSYRVPNLVGLSLTTSDGGALSLELDGQEIGAAARAGQATRHLSLDPQAIVDRSIGANPG